MSSTFPLEDEPQWCKYCEMYTEFAWHDYYTCCECGTFLGDDKPKNKAKRQVIFIDLTQFKDELFKSIFPNFGLSVAIAVIILYLWAKLTLGF